MRRSPSRLAQRQDALRARYRAEPGRAHLRKRARSVSAGTADAVHGTVVPGRNYGVTWAFGIDRAVGGEHDAPNPAEILCAALAACQHATIRMIADAIGITLERLDVEVVGSVDVRGCLAIDSAVEVGFLGLECHVDLLLAPGTDARLYERLRTEAERSCINLATLRSGVPIELAWRTNALEAALTI
jgi:uncharacterized OsmC-like protein